MRSKKSLSGNREAAIVVLLLAIILLILALRYSFLLWDENAYLANARSIIRPSNYSEETRFPLIGYIIAPVWLITGESALVAHILMIFVTAISAWLVYLIAKEATPYPVAVTLFFSVNHLVIYWGYRAYPDMLSLLFILLSFYMIMRERFALAGAFSSLSFLARFPAALFGMAAAIYLFSRKRHRLIPFIIGSMIPLLPWMLVNMIRHGDPVWDLLALYRQIQAYTTGEPILYHLKNLIFTFNIGLLLLPLGIYRMFREKNERLNFLILMYMSFFFIYFLFFVNLKLDRYYLAVLPFIYIAIFMALPHGIRKPYLAIFFVLHLIFSFSVIMDGYNALGCLDSGVIEQSVSYLSSQGADGVIVSNVWPWFGFYLNLRSVSTWSEDIGELIEIYHPEYFVIAEPIGLSFDHGILDRSPAVILEQAFADRCGNKAYVYSTDTGR